VDGLQLRDRRGRHELQRGFCRGTHAFGGEHRCEQRSERVQLDGQRADRGGVAIVASGHGWVVGNARHEVRHAQLSSCA